MLEKKGCLLRTIVAQICLCLLAACLTTTAEDGGVSECLNQADGTDCSTGLCCNQICSTFQSDPLNCGDCGLSCPNGESCSNGVCLDCSTLADGTACSVGTYTGQCCGGTCADLLNDRNNCGGCGANGDAGGPAVCAISENCVDAGCVAQCLSATNNTACSITTVNDGNCCNQVCTNPETDPNNCYLCGSVCPSGTCEDALCTCSSSGQCGQGLTCTSGVCG